MDFKPSVDKGKKSTQKQIFTFDSTKNLDDWVALITDQIHYPLGVFVRNLGNANANDPNLDFDGTLKILEKSALKNKILRITDNIYYTQTHATLGSIQRATVILGFQSIRNIALCIAIFTHIIEVAPNNDILQEIDLSIHAAVLAALIAQRKSKILNSEPIAVAALTYNLGKLLFLFFGGDTAKEYLEHQAQAPVNEEDERKLVGFLFKDLTLALIRFWNLGQQSLHVHDIVNQEDISYSVHIARDVALNLKHDWESPEAISALKSIETYLGINFDDARALALESAEKSLEEASLYHCSRLMDFIPLPAEEELIEYNHLEGENVTPIASRIKATIQQLSILVTSKKVPTVNDIMNVGLKGIFDGVDFDRVLFALLSSNKKILIAKSIFEKHKTDIFQQFQFQLDMPEGWLFQHILREKRPAWLGGKREVVLKKFRNTAFNSKVGKGQFFVAPMILDGKGIGIYFADRCITARQLDTRSYDAFTELCTSINENIELVRKREKQSY
ncbi:MAG: HDOD domain-containing protein [Gammaproteobacteria bacterium]|jgi:HD-like signal output (HDOD) protein|nr:HDOD domain-containing protein [Gammaproteobacteria bacterium]